MIDDPVYDEAINKDQHEQYVRLITFTLEDETYGIEVKQVREILRINERFPVPGAPEYVIGITNIRGNVATVVDARMRFNLPKIDYTDESRMIVIESHDDIVAIVVDSVSDVIDVPESEVNGNMKVNINGDSRFISGVVSRTDGLIIILNVEKFVKEEQFDMAAGF